MSCSIKEATYIKEGVAVGVGDSNSADGFRLVINDPELELVESCDKTFEMPIEGSTSRGDVLDFIRDN